MTVTITTVPTGMVDGTVPRLTMVLNAHRDILKAAMVGRLKFNGTVVVEQPTQDELTAIRSNGASIVAIMPVEPTRPSAGGQIRGRTLGTTTSSTTVFPAANPDGSVSLDGAVTAGLNVHMIVGRPAQDVYLQTADGDVAGGLAGLVNTMIAAINAANVPGVSASLVNGNLVATGPMLHVNIGGSTYFVRETGFIEQRLQIVAWCSNTVQRESVEQVIDETFGTVQQPKLPLADGTKVWTRYLTGPVWSDETIVNSMLKRSDQFYMTRYARLQRVQRTPVGMFQVSQTLPSGTSVSVEG